MSAKSRRVASAEPFGPAYRTTPPPTRGEAALTAGVKIQSGITYGFFTDSTVCIGCKACEAACKQWNQLPMDDFGLKGTSYDNTGKLGARTWRHVAFVEEARGMDAISGDSPFIMMADGKGWLFAASGLKDGPLPTHYEPVESPVRNPLYPQQQINPAAGLFPRPDNRYQKVGDADFPYVITTYRLTEHHTGGAMTRWLPWLAELQPAGFVEISRELAAEKGIGNGDWVTVSTLRGEIEARALVTGRLAPMRVGGRVVHTVGIPWHFGYQGIARGDVANTLSSIVEDPNSLIHEGKVFTGNLRRGRKGERR